MELNDNVTPQGTQPTEPQENGKMFTQEEVNQIVSERLKKERAKATPSEQDKRISELNAKESRLNCREYLMSNGYPSELLDILSSEDSESFIKNVEKLCELYPGLKKQTGSSGMRHDGVGFFEDKIADAFKRK